MRRARGENQGGVGGDADVRQRGKDAVALTSTKTAKMLRPVVVIEAGRTVLRVGGVIQSVHVDEGYEADVWDAMLPRHHPEHVLILGLGGGTMAQLLTARFGPVPITGVEHDPAVVWLARHAFGLDRMPHVRIVLDDAFAFVERATDATERYDTICVDLYTAGKMAHGVLDPTFMRHLAHILSPGGSIMFNLWRSPYLADQLRRIERVLAVRELVEVDDNLVIRCAPLGEADAPAQKR
jgi:spermidine synthase